MLQQKKKPFKDHTTSSSIKRNCTLNVSRESTPNSGAQIKRKKSYKQTWNNIEFWVSHWYFTSPTRSIQLLARANPDRHSPSHHQHYLIGGHGLLQRYWFWKMWTKSLKGGCSSHSVVSMLLTWISCSISVVSTMLPFAVQTLGGWSAWCCLGAR